jgi:hypothetical protein
MLSGGPVSWKSRLQPIVALSSTEADAMNRDFRGSDRVRLKSDGLWSRLFADGISLLGARPRTLAGKVS